MVLMRKEILYIGIAVFFAALAVSFGDMYLGAREVASYYLESGTTATGSPNIVNSIVWDFRGYDTLGEETVLFTAALGVFLVAEKIAQKKKKGE